MANSKKSSEKKSKESSSRRSNTGSSTSTAREEGERSAVLRLLDFYLEQSEKGTPTVLNAVDDLQAVWTQGLRTALGTGRIALDAAGLEDLPVDATERFILNVSDTAGEAQKTMARASMQASTDIAKALRRQFGEEESKKND